MPDARLYLVSALKSRDSGIWDEDDYDVRLSTPDGLVIGRIFRPVLARATSASWFWAIKRIELEQMVEHSTADWGHAASREEAMQALKARWVARQS